MKRFIWTFAIIALITSCKTQQFTMHDAGCTVIRDSMSVTYKQGKDPIPAFPSKGKESNLQAINHLCNQSRLAGDNNRSYEVATRYDGKPKSLPSGGGAKSAESAESVRDLKIRVDTVFIERWHTEVCQPQAVCQRSGPSAGSGLSAKRSQFYKNCTWCFWILLILLLVRIAFRLARLLYLRR